MVRVLYLFKPLLTCEINRAGACSTWEYHGVLEAGEGLALLEGRLGEACSSVRLTVGWRPAA